MSLYGNKMLTAFVRMNYENKIVLLSAKAYFSTRQKTNAHEELPHRTIATHHHCHYLRYTFRKFLPASLVRLFVTFNAIFSEFLNFSIPPHHCGTGHDCHCRHRQRSRTDAGRHGTHCLRSYPILRLSLLLHRYGGISFPHRNRGAVRRSQ